MAPQYFGGTLSELPPSIDSTTVEHMPRLSRLRDLRIRAAMTQAELAEASGVARTTIIRLEAGDPNALPPTMRKLAKALRLRHPSDLWEEPQP